MFFCIHMYIWAFQIIFGVYKLTIIRSIEILIIPFASKNWMTLANCSWWMGENRNWWLLRSFVISSISSGDESGETFLTKDLRFFNVDSACCFRAMSSYLGNFLQAQSRSYGQIWSNHVAILRWDYQKCNTKHACCKKVEYTAAEMSSQY